MARFCIFFSSGESSTISNACLYDYGSNVSPYVLLLLLQSDIDIILLHTQDTAFILCLNKCYIYRYISQQTRGVGPMLGWCWASVVDDGPTSSQHWANASCLPGFFFRNLSRICLFFNYYFCNDMKAHAYFYILIADFKLFPSSYLHTITKNPADICWINLMTNRPTYA